MIDIDKLENCPKRLSISKDLVLKHGTLYETKKYEYRNGYQYYKIIKRIIKKYLNKSFNDAFSEYCNKVHRQYQDRFFMYFSNWEIGYRYNGEPFEDYIVDSDGNIKLTRDIYHRQTKFPKSIKSPNYTSHWVRKNISERKFYNNSYLNLWQIPSYLRDSYVEEIVSGEIKVFESSTREYKRYIKEKNKYHKKLIRKDNHYKKSIVYSYLTKSEKELIESKKNDTIIRDSKGFDKESFIDIEYHGQKRKRLKNGSK